MTRMSMVMAGVITMIDGMKYGVDDDCARTTMARVARITID